MKFLDCQTAVELVMLSRRVPLVVGEAGIGKTSMMRTIAEKNNMAFVNVDGNLLKEGEIGGLPVVEDRTTTSGKIVGKKTIYSLHHKLLEVYNNNRRNPERKILLFIDELNRSEHTVIQELMNLILNREINGYKLPDNCYVVCAMNPSGSSEKYADSNYQVTEMDAAQTSRMIWLHLDTTIEHWLDWATSTPSDKANVAVDENLETLGMLKEHVQDEKETFIHLDIVEFLSSNSEFLHDSNPDLEVRPCPRTWQMVSDIYKTYLDNKDVVAETIFVNCLKGCIGDRAALAFVEFVRTNKKPLIKPEEFFKGKDISKTVSEGFKSDLAPRQMIMIKNCIRYVAALKEEGKLTEAVKLRLVNVFLLAKKDLMISMMSFTKNNFEDLSDELLDLEEYQMLFIETKRQLSKIR